MLVLSRKLNQSIQIGDNISVSVVRIKGNVIQLGIDAPKNVHIVRSELLDKDVRAAAQCQQSCNSTSASSSVDDDTTDEDHASDMPFETAKALFTALRVISESPVGRPPKIPQTPRSFCEPLAHTASIAPC